MSDVEKPSSIRLWLARYKPEVVRCTLRDGSVRELPRPTTARGQWAQLEHAIMLLAPSYLEAFQGKECVASRALETPEDDAESVPAIDDQADPMTALVKALPVIVQLIVDCGDASAARHQAAYELAFQKQLELVKILSDRLSGLERAWHQSLIEKMQSAGDDNDSQAMGMLQAVLMRDAAAAPKNGAAPKKPEDGQ